MPLEPTYSVPVVVHRVFGTKSTGFYVDRRRPSDFTGEFLPNNLAPFVVRGNIRDFRQTIDRRHGTRRQWEDIRAAFTPDTSLAYTDGKTVNDFWRDAGIEFRIVDEVDEKIPSDLADFIPSGWTIWLPVLEPLHRPGVLNIYVCRHLEGRRGQGQLYLPHLDNSVPYVLLSDELSTAETFGYEAWWRQTLIVMAHEFGHVLGLGHVAWQYNVMYGNSTWPGSTNLEAPQWAQARYRAKYLSGAETPVTSLRPDVPRPSWPPI